MHSAMKCKQTPSSHLSCNPTSPKGKKTIWRAIQVAWTWLLKGVDFLSLKLLLFLPCLRINISVASVSQFMQLISYAFDSYILFLAVLIFFPPLKGIFPSILHLPEWAGCPGAHRQACQGRRFRRCFSPCSGPLGLDFGFKWLGPGSDLKGPNQWSLGHADSLDI